MTAARRFARCGHGFLEDAQACPECHPPVFKAQKDLVRGARIKGLMHKCQCCRRTVDATLMHYVNSRWNCIEPCRELEQASTGNGGAARKRKYGGFTI